MSEQPLDLRRSMQTVRRHMAIVTMAAVLGLLAGAAYALLYPPMRVSNALVMLSPSTRETQTQVLIAGSDRVLAGALRSVDPGTSLETLRGRIQVKSLSYNVISIAAEGNTAAQAAGTANAVARSYIHYLRFGGLPGKVVQARILEPATEATIVTPLPIRLLVAGGVGALAGFVAGAVVALAVGRSDRRLRERDEIAESIGVPVLASISAGHPSDTAGWKKLLNEYEPGAVDAWCMRRALQDMGLDSGDDGSISSLAVLSLSHDRKALALGPQLAVFAASLGIPTALVFGPQQDTNATATLRAACAAPPVPLERLRNLDVIVSDQGHTGRLPDARLVVVIAVVDGKAPKFTETIRTTATLLGVSAGAATAEQLAHVAASAAAADRNIGGILVADPESADHTTGRLPWLARPARRRMPTHITGIATETRR